MKQHNISPSPSNSIRKTVPPHSPESNRIHTPSIRQRRRGRVGFSLSEFCPETLQKGLRITPPNILLTENRAPDNGKPYNSALPCPPGKRGEGFAVYSPDYAGNTMLENSGYPVKTRRIPEIAVRRDDRI